MKNRRIKYSAFNSRLRLFPRKLKSRWYGPFSVSKDMRKGAIKIYKEDGNEFIVNKQRVKPYQKDILDTNRDNDITLEDKEKSRILHKISVGKYSRLYLDEKKLDVLGSSLSRFLGFGLGWSDSRQPVNRNANPDVAHPSFKWCNALYNFLELTVREHDLKRILSVKLCLDHKVKRGNKVVKKELIVALRGEIYFVKFIINPEEDDVEPRVIFERSFLQTKEEEKSNDDWNHLLDFNIDDIPLLGTSSSADGHLTQEEATKEALAIRMSQKFALL
ncbi:hypothetical protein Tco_0051542 [Tanacetum coccineum]